MTRFAINKEFNGIEITFDSKPAAETLEALKASGYRWHRAKKVWYAKQTTERLALAQTIAGEQITETTKASKPTEAETINLDNLGQNAPHLYGAELAKAIREDLKRRGVKGCTVRTRKVTYDTGITVTVKAGSSDIVSLEEYTERYSFAEFACDAMNYHGVFDGSRWIYAATWEAMTDEERREAYRTHAEYYLSKSPNFYRAGERKDYKTITTAFYNKLCAIYKIANQWNYDNSDIMTDYFDVGYYLDIDIKMPEDFELREEMTEEEREAYAAEVKAEEEAKEAALAAWKAEQAESRKRAEEAEKKRTEQMEIIANGSAVEDLNEGEQLYISSLRGGVGKECDLEELRETLASGHYLTEDALIVRKVHMAPEAFVAFCDNFLESFDFLEHMGGTGSEDVRLDQVSNIYSMTTEQRESVKWYICNAVAICVDGEIKLVCDPQGHNYSRYTYILTDESEITSADATTEEQRTESESKPAFYFPDPVTDQAQNITPGEAVTVYQCDGWNLTSIYAGSGIVKTTRAGDYAQYKGVWVDFTNGKSVFIRDGKKCLIYKGIKPLLPDHITKKQLSPMMYELYNSDALLANAYSYYLTLGEHPIIDTVQR